MNNYHKRKVVVFDLPIKEEIIILKPEQVILKYGKYGTLDIGSLCYFDRFHNKKRLPNEGLLVNIQSLNLKRVAHIKKLIQIISEKFAYSNLSKETLYNHSRYFLFFIKWADSNKYYNYFDDEIQAKEIFSIFVNELKDKISKNELNPHTATIIQNISLKFLEEFFNIDNLSIGIPLIYGAIKNNPTSPPSEYSQNKVLLLCDHLFEGISDFILNNKSFPYKLNVPEHIGWENNSFYIFPLLAWAVNPKNYKEKQGNIWNANNGRLISKDEINKLYKTYKIGNNAFNRAKKMIHESNLNQYSIYKINLATVAHHAFSLIFLATTGMNKQSLINLHWDDKFEISSERQGFKTIKSRAGNKICSFEISTHMVDKFKQFLKLRKYLLNTENCDFLFFSLGNNTSQKPSQLTGTSIYNIFDTLKKIDPSISKITPRQWRAAKSDWLIKNTDISTAALILQNSETVLLNHYTAGSETDHLKELSHFFSEVSKYVLANNEHIEGQSSSVGKCLDYGHPSSLKKNPIKVNCKTPEGCLFCDKYRIHADEKDTRKLVSCRYCLQKTALLSNNKEDFDNVFGKIFQRIEELLKQIDEIKPGLPQKIINEVEQMGELDPYWARKLELLFDLGLVS